MAIIIRVQRIFRPVDNVVLLLRWSAQGCDSKPMDNYMYCDGIDEIVNKTEMNIF